jgi:hypothetical protein
MVRENTRRPEIIIARLFDDMSWLNHVIILFKPANGFNI